MKRLAKRLDRWKPAAPAAMTAGRVAALSRTTRTPRALAPMAAIATVVALALAGAAQANVGVSNSGWEWANPTPQGRTLNAIAFSEGTGYAVGAGGTALATSDAGAEWTGLTTGTSANLERVQALAPSTIVLGGGSGCVTRISQDGGKVFERIFGVAESKCPEPVAAFSFVSPEVGFLLLRNGSLEVTTDGGETFSRRTGVPGTAASSGGGEMVGAEVHFSSPTSGLAFVNEPNGESRAFATPDGGVSWTPVTLPAGSRVGSVRFVDAQNAYAIGPETLLRSTDGGATWKAEPIAKGNEFRSIDCSTATTCVLSIATGNEIVRTSNGGETDTTSTTSSSLIYGAAYASATQIVAVGASGATVLSADGGSTFAPASADIGGEYTRLRQGPGGLLVAPGADGDIALSSDNGETWRVVATQTSKTLVDAAFGTSSLGYALDVSGGLQRTNNGGTSWQTLSAGTPRPARAIVAFGSRSALLLGPSGVYRSTSGGPFEPVSSRAAHAAVSDYSRTGSWVFAFAPGSHTLIDSGDEGASWAKVSLPMSRKARVVKGKKVKAKPGVRVRSVAFTSAKRGLLLDTSGRLWSTNDGGSSWREVLSAGTSSGVQLAFSSERDGYMSVRGYPAEPGVAYVLRTTNGGATWHPQEITTGYLPYGGLVSSSTEGASALVYGVTGGSTTLRRLLFTTSSGGDVAGTTERLSLSTAKRKLTSKALKHAKDEVRVTGSLTGAIGGERIVVSRRNVSGGSWQQQVVVAGANGGSFATTWRVKSSSVFVAHWAGDSGRPGEGSEVLTVTVKKSKPKKGSAKKGAGKHGSAKKG